LQFEKISASSYERTSGREDAAMYVFAIGAIFALSSLLGDVVAENNVKRKEQIRVLSVNRTPEPDTVILTAALPKPNEVVTDSKIWMQLRIEGYPLGAGSSQFDRSGEVAVSDMGQTVHVIIDDNPYFPINSPALNPFNEEGNFRITDYRFELPFKLSTGVHTVRMFPTRSFGESLKGSDTFVGYSFYVGKKEGPPFDFSQPFLTYNEPGDSIPLCRFKPILLDFLVTNCELTADGYKVRFSIDGQVTRILTSWQPYYIYGLPSGTHTIRLELLNEKNQIVKGLFNDVKRTIKVN
jgi:hypothetical protein